MSRLTKDASWRWACLLAALFAAVGWLALPLQAGIANSRWTWVNEVGFIIQLPAAMLISVFTFIVPGGFHNHGYFYRATPFVTWFLYTLAIRWLLSIWRGKTG